MLGKNNYNERLRKMEMQAKQDHFSIRKLNVGVASVLLGFTFFGLNSQAVKAETVAPTEDARTNTPAAETRAPSDTRVPLVADNINDSPAAPVTEQAPTKSNKPTTGTPANVNEQAIAPKKSIETWAKRSQTDLSTYRGLKSFFAGKRKRRPIHSKRSASSKSTSCY
ncbi:MULTISPECIES: YSIRK-type signal peptide-containing protein [unclassified Lactobacillus]|uniref:YSIRK-type signal peptide-containing protein n=1 Tax=unclassified Lactobacillus TaxID=2620435 RepID=UPI000EFBF0ED|nr:MULTISPECIES: YSIRK-type signal peptide-containing protein [unclassified Lactobacillus]RMC25081.1 YSIRK-type signal peptide-containing protein [Lactobacillus sp. ESL0247]RMC29236.1 YSIRK-type signal peptide-containing protein [Lactobacillus sp. ESL0246]RMC32839.1 YSIRK-type signal peptide-containing protein [Lactobacillus sp. ESL0245]